ncbi:MAG: polysaccharide export protein [Alphaproteobacteria bacterium]|nr:polysaccharide export protein [Alphaproteobacteria bacterium]
MATVLVSACAALLGACVRMDLPQNFNDQLYAPETSKKPEHRPGKSPSYAHQRCAPAGAPDFMLAAKRAKQVRHMPPMRYSPGDRLNVMIFDSEELSGDYAVNLDGTVNLPYAGAINAAGLTNSQLSHRIARALTKKGLFTAEASQISVQPVQYSAVNVTVVGAVFNPGRVTINAVREKERFDARKSKSGDNPLERRVPAALMAVGGVRPDADLSKVKVYRQGKVHTLDWRGAFSGLPVDDMPLIEGDHIEIPEAGCFQSALVRPSQITPGAVRLFISNLTQPGLNNANSVTNQDTSGGVPYGTRLLQALVQANCVGGSYSSNAKRYAVLITRNPKTRKTEVIQRAIEDLVRRSDRDTINPFLMPEDAIACYDSSVIEFREVMNTIYGTIAPPIGLSKL